MNPRNLFLAFALLGCRGSQSGTAPGPVSPPPEPEVRYTMDPDFRGLKFSLREATPPAAAGEAVPLGTGTPLSDADIDRLLARTEPLVAGDDDRKAFALRAASEPPPKTGALVVEAFPPSQSPAEQPTPPPPGPLHVTRHAPDGEMGVVPHVTVSFDQPMIAVTSQEEASRNVPVKLEPQPPGKWRWLGTQTIQFDPDTRTGEPVGRLPASTSYTVTIPAGTKSATGGVLGEAQQFTFTTPTVQITDLAPQGGPYGLEPVFAFQLDQEVDPTALLAVATLDGGGKRYELRLATEAEVEADKTALTWKRAAQKGRFVALKAKETLPKDTSFALAVREGLRSLEGPRTTSSASNFGFFTYAPLKVVRYQCGWNSVCRPDMPFVIELNNPLDPDAFDPASVTIDPPFEAVIGVSGDSIAINGRKDGRTTYTVTVPAALTDMFGQTLFAAKAVSFDVGPAEKTLYGPGQQMLVLDPGQKPQYPVWSVNHKALKVEIHRVTPQDWPLWQRFLRKWNYDDAKPGPRPGTPLRTEVVKIDVAPDRLVETALDLSPYLVDGHGQFLVWVEPTTQPANRWERQNAYAWIQVTDLGLTAFVDRDEAIVWTASLTSGDTMDGVALEMIPGGTATSGADGLGALALPVGSTLDRDGYTEQQVIVARKGTDVAILPESNGFGGGGGWIVQDQLDQLRWYVFDDRGMYRPKEKVRVKGWLRRFEDRTHGDLTALGDGAPSTVKWQLTSSQGNPMGEGEVALSALGGFDIAFEIPETPNLGTAQLTLVAQGSSLGSTVTSHPIEIQEFRRPEFEVSATAPEGSWSLGEEATFSVGASYYAGGGLPSAQVTWQVWSEPTSYAPPGHEGWSFGRWIPWWDPDFGGGQDNRYDQALQGKTDASGKHYVAAHFESVTPPRPSNVTAQASVMDVNRQQWTSSATLLVHPSDVYVGLKTERAFVQKGDPIALRVIAVDPEGTSLSSQVEVHAARMVSVFEGGMYTQVEKETQDCAVLASADVGTCTFEGLVGGMWRIRATASDTLGRKNETELTVWVAGGDVASQRGISQEKVTLVPEKQEYQPGETAKFLVQAPFEPAEGTLTIARSGVVRQQRFRMDAATTTLEVPILEEHIPGFTVQIDLVGQQARTDDHGKKRDDLAKRTAFATGTLAFEVPPLARKLTVDVRPGAPKVEPGGSTEIVVLVTDAAGKPVADAELVVVAADESVLALSGYKLPDPLAVFYAGRPSGVSTVDLRRNVLLVDTTTVTGAVGDAMGIDGLGMRGSGIGGGGMGGASSNENVYLGAPMVPPPAARLRQESTTEAKKEGRGDDDAGNAMPDTAIALRTNFDALALFAPEVRTGADGRAVVPLKVPDSLTRYRVMVVAVAGGKQFGSGESNVTARLPLMVRPSPPRFLNFGDQAEVPIVLQNQTDEEMTVDVALRATNVVFIDHTGPTMPDDTGAPYGQGGRRVRVPANDRVEVRFPVATSMAGTARFQAVAGSGKISDAARFELPVWTPATTEAFATYGTTTDVAVVQPVAAPGDVWPQFGGLEIQTSSTQLQALTDAVLYIQRYPYDCNEQIASRTLGIAALRDVLTAFESPLLPPAADLEKQVEHDLRRLSDRQNGDGGFAFWRRGDESWPYLGIYGAHAYAEAKVKRYDVPSQAWSRSLSYLRNIQRHIPGWYSLEEKWFLRSYAAYVRWRMGDLDVGEAKAILRESGGKRLSLEGHGMLLPLLHAGNEKALVASELQYLANHGTETAGAMAFGDTYEHGAHVLLASSRRADGVILRGLLSVDPMNDMVPKIVKGLLAHRKKGHWANTQEDTFILLALDTYFAIYEKETPDFVARMWLGEGYVGDHAFRGRTTETALSSIPMGYLTERKGAQDLVIDKQGTGRLYYRIGMTYAPRDLDLEAADYGFVVQRTYEPIDDPKDVTRDADGTWHIAAGKQVRVRLVMVAQARRYHVALVDPLPAGLEAENPALATTGALPSDPKAVDDQPWWMWWTRTWYEHENLRDERVEAFTSLLRDGAWEYTYVARATTPGRYVVPPAKAEEMYAPETFGRSATDRVIVE